MGVIDRVFVFAIGTTGNAILFMFHSRVLLELVGFVNGRGEGPATDAINLLPTTVQIAIGIIQVVLVAYLLGAFAEERTVTRRPA
jgi:hypothetical protein